MHTGYVILITVIIGHSTSNKHNSGATIEDQNYWFELGANDLNSALQHKQLNGEAKNVILFIGDGLGLSTITAARIYGKTESGYLAFDKFPNVGVLKTYSANKIVPDSCSTATAMFCGVKANQKTSGVDATVEQDDCNASLNPDARLESILSWAQKSGKKTGFVTTTRVTHATPSALYAHTPNRSWECEAKMPKNASGCKDIARQLIEDAPGRYINVIMGGGRQCLQSNSQNFPGDPVDTWACQSGDGRNLISDWEREKRSRGVSHAIITNNEELQNLGHTEYVLGIFANGHLKMEHARDAGPKGMPSLMNMTEAAIRVLQNNENGYILVIEGGMIDFAHHRGHARQALSETIAFSDAIEKAVQLTSHKSEETLIVVTSDHSHPLVIGGYAYRGAKITGIAQKSATDNVPYTTLLYGIGGPDNYKYSVINGSVVRHDPSNDDTDDYNYAQQAGVLTSEVTHDGTDVLVYAKGPMAHLFHSVHEQTYVAHVIGYAAKIGPYEEPGNNSSNKNVYHCYLLVLILAISLNI